MPLFAHFLHIQPSEFWRLTGREYAACRAYIDEVTSG